MVNLVWKDRIFVKITCHYRSTCRKNMKNHTSLVIFFFLKKKSETSLETHVISNDRRNFKISTIVFEVQILFEISFWNYVHDFLRIMLWKILAFRCFDHQINGLLGNSDLGLTTFAKWLRFRACCISLQSRGSVRWPSTWWIAGDIKNISCRPRDCVHWDSEFPRKIEGWHDFMLGGMFIPVVNNEMKKYQSQLVSRISEPSTVYSKWEPSYSRSGLPLPRVSGDDSAWQEDHNWLFVHVTLASVRRIEFGALPRKKYVLHVPS